MQWTARRAAADARRYEKTDLLAWKGIEMKPYRPDILEFNSDGMRHQLKIPIPPEAATLTWDGEEYKWPEVENSHPKLVLFNITKKQVILIGGLGDPGMDLGCIYFHSLQGEMVKYIDLKTEIPDLETMSRDWRELSNFPWLAAGDLDPGGENLFLWVCRKIKVTIALNDYIVSTEPSANSNLWKDMRPVHNKGMANPID